MIKTIGIGVWVCLISLASVYFSVQVATKEEVPEADPILANLQTIRGDITTIPVIADGGVKGYFLTRLSYRADPHEIQKLSLAPQEMITDALYSELVGNKAIDFSNIDQFDLASFKANIKDSLNKRVGGEVFHDVIVEQIDFLSKDDIRASLSKSDGSISKKRQKLIEGEPLPEDKHSAPSH